MSSEEGTPLYIFGIKNIKNNKLKKKSRTQFNLERKVSIIKQLLTKYDASFKYNILKKKMPQRV